MQETWVQFLGQEDPLENEMATHSSIPDWEIPWTEETGGAFFTTSTNFTVIMMPTLQINLRNNQ